MKKKIVLCISALLLVSSLLFACAPASTEPAAPVAPVPVVDEKTGDVSTAIPTVSVSGEGRFEIKPDKATMQFGVEVLDQKTAQEALDAINVKMDEIGKALQGLGIAEGDLQTANFNVYESYKYDRQGNIQSGPYFNATTSLTVTIYDIDNIGTIIDGGITAGATNTYGITFGVKDETRKASETEAINSAMENARNRAEALATAASRTLGDVLIISDGTQITEQVMYNDAVNTQVEMAVAEDAAGYSGARSAAAVMPGTTIITARVSVRFTMK